MTPRTRQEPIHELIFYKTLSGEEPTRGWMRELAPTKRRALGYAMHDVLAQQGVDVCGEGWGKPLGEGLYEFRLRDESRGQSGTASILLRVFFHPFGEKKILLLHGYDKGEHPGSRYQQQQIAIARKRLKDFQANARLLGLS